MSLDNILLGLLRQPASGYDLKRVFDESIGHFWAAELSQIYPTLKRLEKRGWLGSRKVDSQQGPGRCVYQTTAAGRAALRDWLESGPQLGDERFAYLAQVYFMDELGDASKTLRFLVRLRESVSGKLDLLQQTESRWAQLDARYPDQLPAFDFHVQLTLRMGLMTLAAKLEWCDESIRRVRSRAERAEKQRGPSKSRTDSMKRRARAGGK
jgi:PadR family transcriptional regulator, regulatory protein AphA